MDYGILFLSLFSERVCLVFMFSFPSCVTGDVYGLFVVSFPFSLPFLNSSSLSHCLQLHWHKHSITCYLPGSREKQKKKKKLLT